MPPLMKPTVLTATIANGASLSDAIDVGVGAVLGFNVPTITTAVLTFQGSDDGVTFTNVKDAAGAEVQIGSSAGAMFVSAPAALSAVAFLKIRTGTSGAPVAQGGQRLVGVVIK